jgi:hypothetical protein
MGYPAVARVRVVLDHDQAATRLEIAAPLLQHPNLIAHVMQGVRRQHPIQRRQIERRGEIGHPRDQPCPRKLAIHGSLQRAQAPGIRIDGNDLDIGSGHLP